MNVPCRPRHTRPTAPMPHSRRRFVESPAVVRYSRKARYVLRVEPLEIVRLWDRNTRTSLEYYGSMGVLAADGRRAEGNPPLVLVDARCSRARLGFGGKGVPVLVDPFWGPVQSVSGKNHGMGKEGADGGMELPWGLLGWPVRPSLFCHDTKPDEPFIPIRLLIPAVVAYNPPRAPFSPARLLPSLPPSPFPSSPSSKPASSPDATA